MRYACRNIETDYATLADEQAQVRKLLAEVREALEMRADMMRASLVMGITLGHAERVLTELVEPATRPAPTLGHGLEVAS